MPRLGALGIGFTVCFTACSPSLNWREVHPESSDEMVAMFPCKPEHHARQLALPGLTGGPVTLHVLSCEADGARWALTYLNAGDPVRRSQALGLLSQSLNANMQPGQHPRPPKDLGPTQVPGMTQHPDARTWWQSGARPVTAERMAPVQVVAWHFSHGLRVYQASVWQASLSPNDPRLTTFANGFNFPR